MKRLFRGTNVYRALRAEAEGEERSSAVFVLFPDGKYLRALLKECAKAFFGAEDGSRVERLIDKESYADCLFYPAEEGKLTADDCSAVVEESLLRPVEGPRKLFVLDRFHLATPVVQNKLLKILEEPPRGVHFLIGAESEYPVLPTVLSRVKKFVPAPFPEEEIERVLSEAYGTDAGEAAAACGGVLSVAENLLSGGGEEFRLAERFLALEDTVEFCRRTGERKTKREFFAALKSVLRDMLFLSAGQGKYAKRRDETIVALAREYPLGAVVAALERTGEAEKQVTFNANFASCLYALATGIAEEKLKWQRLS